MTYYPARARELGRKGSADVQCRVAKDGTMTSCAWISDDPSGFGFGEAGAKVACLMKMKATFSIEGWIFRKTIRFDLAP